MDNNDQYLASMVAIILNGSDPLDRVEPRGTLKRYLAVNQDCALDPELIGGCKNFSENADVMALTDCAYRVGKKMNADLKELTDAPRIARIRLRSQKHTTRRTILALLKLLCESGYLIACECRQDVIREYASTIGIRIIRRSEDQQ